MLKRLLSVLLAAIMLTAVITAEPAAWFESGAPVDPAAPGGLGFDLPTLSYSLNPEDNFIFLEPVDIGDSGSGIQTYASSVESYPLFKTVDEAAAYYKQCVKNRSEYNYRLSVNLPYVENGWQPYANQYIDSVIAKAEEHNGVADEGDYLRQSTGAYIGVRISGKTIVEVYTYSDLSKYPYYSTAAQERQVGPAVSKLINQLGLNGMSSDYEKIKAVYEWLVINVSYDHDRLNDGTYMTKHGAYAAMIDNTCVCSGYALLFYRIMLTVGIDCRYITGNATAGTDSYHAWNIVKLDGKWYLVDATWDADTYHTWKDKYGATWTERRWLLRGSNSEHFAGREWDEQFTTAEFKAQYPIAICDYNDHNTELVDAKEADCIHTGYTGDEICIICGDLIAKGSVIPAKGHSYGDDDICDVCEFDRSNPQPGDINADGEVNVQDGVLMQRILANLESNPEYILRADLYGDGVPNVQDGVKMQRILANLE